MNASRREVLIIVAAGVLVFTGIGAVLGTMMSNLDALPITLVFFVVSICLGAAAFCVFLWAVREKQFSNMEDIGRRMVDFD